MYRLGFVSFVLLLAVASAGCAGLVSGASSSSPVAPSITSPPASQTVTAGQTGSFSVAATGTAPLSYQWRRNGTAISGATSSTYTTPATTSSDNGAQFTVLVSNTAGSVASNPAALTVNAAPVAPSITTQPASQTVTAGQAASFSVAATGTAPLGYQWRKNGTPISGATSSGYTTPATTSSDNGALFTVVVSNTAGSVTSSAATLSVNAAPVAPSITSQPASQTVIVGQTASFSVTATGTTPLTYQWRKNGTAISGASSSSYTTPATTSSDNGAQFTVLVSNTTGSVTSSAATLTVNPAPTPSIQVSPTSINFGNTVVGSTLSQVLIITNTGTATLSITQVTGSGSAFTVSGFSLPLNVGPGQQTTIAVAFLPTSVGAASGNVSIVSNAPTSPTSVGLSGTGIAATYTLGISPTNLSFGNVTTGTSSAPQGVTITNTGNSDVTITQINVLGAGFSGSGVSPGTTLAPNQSVTLSVVFAPTIAGSVTGSVTVVSSASNSPAIITLSGTGAATTPSINVMSYGATGNGTTNDTAAINSAISALTSGATLFFPCGTYLTTSQLSINTPNVTIDGGSCATIRNAASGGNIMVIGNGAFSGSYGTAVALSAVANELTTSFTTVASLGISAGDYVYIHQGGIDYSTDTLPGHPTNCDVFGCRGEVLKVASVSGNTVTVSTALHDTYNPVVNAAVVQKILSPVTGITVQNITLDGSGTTNYGLLMLGVVNSTVSGVTAKNVVYTAMYGNSNFNLAWNSVTITGAGNRNGSAFGIFVQGSPSISGLSLSNLNQGSVPAAFGVAISSAANGTFDNITVDASGAFGRPFKTAAARYNTFNSLTVRNVASNYNGISLEYYSSHNIFNSCVATNNGTAGTGTGNAGINTFGNFNQYNAFNNCTVSGNGNVQFMIGKWDALQLGQDSNITINGGTYTGTNTVEPVIYINGSNVKVTLANINGQGAQGLYLGSTNACVNNNTFGAGTGLGAGIWSGSSSNMGSGNVMNGYSSNLTPGTCTAP